MNGEGLETRDSERKRRQSFLLNAARRFQEKGGGRKKFIGKKIKYGRKKNKGGEGNTSIQITPGKPFAVENRPPYLKMHEANRRRGTLPFRDIRKKSSQPLGENEKNGRSGKGKGIPSENGSPSFLLKAAIVLEKYSKGKDAVPRLLSRQGAF